MKSLLGRTKPTAPRFGQSCSRENQSMYWRLHVAI